MKHTLAPILLPSSPLMWNPGSGSRHLQSCIDSLGYPETREWGPSLRVADALSVGIPTVKEVAVHAGIAPQSVPERVQDLRSIFGIQPIPGLVYRLLAEGLLPFQRRGTIQKLSTDLNAALHAGIQGVELGDNAKEELYKALDARKTLPAAIRSAFELGVLTPRRSASAKRIGFFALHDRPLPRQYPLPPRAGVCHTALLATHMQIDYPMTPTDNPRAGTFSPTELGIASLAALGCSNEQIGKRLSPPLSRSKVKTHLAAVGKRLEVSGRDAIVDQLFFNDIFFVVQKSDT